MVENDKRAGFVGLIAVVNLAVIALCVGGIVAPWWGCTSDGFWGVICDRSDAQCSQSSEPVLSVAAARTTPPPPAPTPIQGVIAGSRPTPAPPTRQWTCVQSSGCPNPAPPPPEDFESRWGPAPAQGNGQIRHGDLEARVLPEGTAVGVDTGAQPFTPAPAVAPTPQPTSRFQDVPTLTREPKPNTIWEAIWDNNRPPADRERYREEVATEPYDWMTTERPIVATGDVEGQGGPTQPPEGRVFSLCNETMTLWEECELRKECDLVLGYRVCVILGLCFNVMGFLLLLYGALSGAIWKQPPTILLLVGCFMSISCPVLLVAPIVAAVVDINYPLDGPGMVCTVVGLFLGLAASFLAFEAAVFTGKEPEMPSRSEEEDLPPLPMPQKDAAEAAVLALAKFDPDQEANLEVLGPAAPRMSGLQLEATLPGSPEGGTTATLAPSLRPLGMAAGPEATMAAANSLLSGGALRSLAAASGPAAAPATTMSATGLKALTASGTTNAMSSSGSPGGLLAIEASQQASAAPLAVAPVALGAATSSLAGPSYDDDDALALTLTAPVALERPDDPRIRKGLGRFLEGDGSIYAVRGMLESALEQSGGSASATGGWSARTSRQTGAQYYVNDRTGEAQWTLPDDYRGPPSEVSAGSRSWASRPDPLGGSWTMKRSKRTGQVYSVRQAW